ncbi:enoyl-CoA hydratase-related protein [Candidatus Entotheonella palauensis]|uniref:Uncharacterized protein n=1 Tax=Candidatus Entotheonella gemina TaxID=1429439 RepID=W4LST3_9BACT|nr:enoyl-CoA hydratase-related protein [Candidatus Entotheonella palauensis]ETX01038.1 MAG: hypothetical protein ETSY2_37915 [Candidatus Entotheonella gemina]
MQTGPFTGFGVVMHDPGIALITLNQPGRLNGMTHHMKRDLVETLVQAQMDDAVRVIVFTGSGRAFSAGDDITGRAIEPEDAQPLVPDIPPGHHNAMGTYNGLRFLSQSLNAVVRDIDKLTVAAINGVAIQTGLSLALACDFRVTSTEARLGSATLRFGLLPDEGGQFLLVQLLGVAKAMDFLMRKRIVSAEEALELGLVHEIAPPAELMDRTLALARELAEGPQVAMRMLKRSIYNAAEMTFAQSLDEIAAKTAVTDHHPDAREGVQSELPVVAVAGDERMLLEQVLDYYRAVVARKLHGVSDADALRLRTPSGMSMLGLVRHLAGVELWWLVEALTGDAPQYLWTQADYETDPDTDWKPRADETVASVLAFYHRACDEARSAVRRFELDDQARHADVAARGITLRWLLLHMLEETARHAGHLDVMREQVDGAVGD